MAEPIRPPFRPTKEQAMKIFYALNGDSNELQKAKGRCTIDSSKALKVYKLA